MGPNIALDIAVLQTFDAVHACLSGGAADLRKTWISRAETGSTCDRVGVSAPKFAEKVAMHRHISRCRGFDAIAGVLIFQ
jgi:hypothetical protein